MVEKCVENVLSNIATWKSHPSGAKYQGRRTATEAKGQCWPKNTWELIGQGVIEAEDQKKVCNHQKRKVISER